MASIDLCVARRRHRRPATATALAAVDWSWADGERGLRLGPLLAHHEAVVVDPGWGPRMGKAKKVPCKMMVHIWGSIRWQGRRRWLRLTDVPMSLVTNALAEPSRSCYFKGGRKKRTKRRLPLPAPRLHAGAQTCHWECSKRNQKALIRYLEEMTVASLHLAGSLILVWHNRDSCKQRNGTSYESPLTSKNSITMKYYSKNANTPHHVGDDVPPCFSRQAR